jgi:N-acylneuraminate cytidylyltransferase
MHTVAIILARGGSKGIPSKNIIDFCGKPLINWTIENCLHGGISQVYVSSDSDTILNIADEAGAECILRPKNLSSDISTSESGWLHAVEVIESKSQIIDWVFAPQVTSPLRTKIDVRDSVTLAEKNIYDSIFSCSLADDLFLWKNTNNAFESINYNWRNRKRRQDIDSQFIENGSFYLFKPGILRKNNNRFGGKIGVFEMEFWKMFEIDTKLDLKLCSAIMKEFILES